MENFDYEKAMESLEEIAVKVEDPSTGIGDIDKYIIQTDKLVGQCRAYLRSAREKVDNLDKQ